MLLEFQPTTMYKCNYCARQFQKETTLAVHLCEQKARHKEKNETGVQIGLQAYLRFYEVHQGSAKLKTFDDFASSSYYRAFVKFGRHCQAIRAVNVARFVDWLLKHNKKIDHWHRDSLYNEYLQDHVRAEAVQDALTRAMEFSIEWNAETQNPAHDCLRYGNVNALCYAIVSGRITGWVLYNSESGKDLLDRLNQEQIAMIWPMIDPDFWRKKFKDYAADTEYCRTLLEQAGW